jgi:hypothetical protein
MSLVTMKRFPENTSYDVLSSLFFWNAKHVQLTPGWLNDASASRFNVQKRFERRANANVSSAETSNMRRPGGIEPVPQ